MTPDDEILQRLDRESARKTECVRAMLLEAGRPDLVADLDAKLRDIRLGLDSARSCWHSISSRQRFVLRLMGRGYMLRRAARARTVYDAYGQGHVVMMACKLSTARALCGHALIHVAGGATDPEAMFVLTERGQFVLKHGVPE